MTAIGRKRTVILFIFEPTERPVSGKADIHQKGRYESDPLLALVRASVVLAHLWGLLLYTPKYWAITTNQHFESVE